MNHVHENSSYVINILCAERMSANNTTATGNTAPFGYRYMEADSYASSEARGTGLSIQPKQSTICHGPSLEVLIAQCLSALEELVYAHEGHDVRLADGYIA